MRKILVVGKAADVYGSDLQMLTSVQAFADHGWDAVVVSREDGPLNDLVIEAGARLVRSDYPLLARAYMSVGGVARLAAALATSIPRIVRLIRRERPDVIYVNTIALPWWLLAARIARVPVLCHVHEAEAADPQPVLKVLYAPLIMANRVVANGAPAAELAQRIVPRLAPNIDVIPNGFDAPDTVDDPPPAPPWRVLCLGRLSPRKSTATAIEMLALLRSRGVDAQLELCGSTADGYEWYETELIELAARLDVTEQVEFAGYEPDVWQALRRCHILVAPSLGESLGNAVIEAQMAGRPVVATDVQGHRESIEAGATGLLVPADDPAAMADAVASLLDEPGLAERLGRTACTEARERYGLERYSTQIIAAANSLIA